MALPTPRDMPQIRAEIQRPAGTYRVFLPGGRVVECIDEDAVRRLVRREAPGSVPRFVEPSNDEAGQPV